ncbi:MAG: hypothetical protein PQ275_25070 [Elizabethkingia anophelis]|nr:MAG: hypothetical protein PQ275_25070 [Elizabethkingia anophelis]
MKHLSKKEEVALEALLYETKKTLPDGSVLYLNSDLNYKEAEWINISVNLLE